MNYTEEQVKEATEYFEQNPDAVKFSRKQSGFTHSFIRTSDKDKGLQHDIFIISRTILGSGSNGVVKIGKNTKTNQIVAIKIILAEDDSDFWFNEVLILSKLNRLYGTTNRSSIAETKKGWLNKRERLAKYKNDIYNFKNYIFKVFCEGITLQEYFLIHNPSNIEIVKILLKILDQLSILHNQGITHGDLNFKNILINNSNDNFDIEIIDFGLANKVSEEGIRAFPVHQYKFSRDHYLPPECDYTLSKKLFDNKPIDNNCLSKILNWAKQGYGFNTATSDTYSLIWSINHFCNRRHQQQDLFLSYLYNVTCKKSCPILRPSLEEITTECQQYFEKLSLKP